jgi:hypothetical protein
MKSLKQVLISVTFGFLMFCSAVFAQQLPWTLRADGLPGSAAAQPEVQRWCIPATDSSLPIRTAMEAQNMVLAVKLAVDSALVVAPSKTMTQEQWDTMVGELSWVKAQLDSFATDLSTKPAQTLATFTAQCNASDPTVQAKLDKALADLAAANAKLTAANDNIASVTVQLNDANNRIVAILKDNAALNTALAAAEAEVSRIRAFFRSLVAQ